jgi:hypothetical protein
MLAVVRVSKAVGFSDRYTLALFIIISQFDTYYNILLPLYIVVYSTSSVACSALHLL